MRNELVQLLANPAFNLNSTLRYSSKYLVRPENSAEHTAQVCIMGVFIGARLRELGESVDIHLIAYKGTIHDIEESITCDVPRNVKYASTQIRDALKDVELKAVEIIAKDAGFPSLVHDWASAKDSSVEGLIIKLCDMFTVVRKCLEELDTLGNRHVLSISREVLHHLRDCKVYVEQACDTLTTEDGKMYLQNLHTNSLEIVESLISGNFNHNLDIC